MKSAKITFAKITMVDFMENSGTMPSLKTVFDPKSCHDAAYVVLLAIQDPMKIGGTYHIKPMPNSW